MENPVDNHTRIHTYIYIHTEREGRRQRWRSGGTIEKGEEDQRREREGRVYSVRVHGTSSTVTKQVGQGGGRREFRMDVTAIRTRVCDHARKVHVPISIHLLSLSLSL